MSHSRISDCAEALKLTRLWNGAKLPICADTTSREKLSEWLKAKKFATVEDYSQSTAYKRLAAHHKRSQQADLKWQDDDMARRIQLEKERSGSCRVNYQPAHKQKQKPLCPLCIAINAMLSEKDKQWQHLTDKDYRAKQPKDLMHRSNEAELPNIHIAAGEDDDPVEESSSSTQHLFQDFSDAGVFTATWDAWKSYVWDLFTHAGFYTGPHHDGSGMGTWIWIRTGCKIWSPLRPKLPDVANICRNDLYNVMRECLLAPPSTSYQEHADTFSIFVLEGDVL